MTVGKILIALVASGMTVGAHAVGFSDLAVKALELEALHTVQGMPAPHVANASLAGIADISSDKSRMGNGLKIQAFNGKLSASGGVNLAGQRLNLKVNWYCVKSDFFSSTGWKSCGDEYQGERAIRIDGAGNFSFPNIIVNGPLVGGVFVVKITLVQNGKDLKVLGDYCDEGYYVNPRPVSRIESDLKNLRVVLVGGQYSANILTKEAGQPGIRL